MINREERIGSLSSRHDISSNKVNNLKVKLKACRTKNNETEFALKDHHHYF